MALIASPYGLSPVGTLTGAAYNEQGRLYAIPATDTTTTYAIGDVVSIATGSDSNGVPYVKKPATGSYSATVVPLGIVVGIRVADPGVSLVGNSLSLEKSYLAKNGGVVRYVYVVDDPNIIFKVQFDATGAAQNDMHKLASLTIVADQTSLLSNSAPFSNIVATGPATSYTAGTTFIQLLGAYQDSINSGAIASAASASTAVPYINVLAKWNQHQFGNIGLVGI
jgi:hypothetical protein